MSKLFEREDVIKEIEENGCKLINEPENNQSPMMLKCSCGRIFTTTYARVKQFHKTKCDVCTGRKLDKQYVEEYLVQHGATLMSDYKITNGKIKIKCHCGNIFETTFSKVKNRNKFRCNKCTIGRDNSMYLTIEEVDDVLRKNKIERLSEYIDSSKKMTLRCRCGKIFKRSFNKIQNGQIVCNTCSKHTSKIELLAEEFLDKNKCNYVEQYHFPDLKTRNNVYLRFDFALFDSDMNLLCLVELDGEQHYHPVKAWGGKEGFERRTMLDNMKNKYCQEHNIKLYRIPYWNFNKINEEMKNIIDKEILCQASE